MADLAAACREQGATAFLSNDRDLRRLTDLPVWMLEDFVWTAPAARGRRALALFSPGQTERLSARRVPINLQCVEKPAAFLRTEC